MSLTNADSCSDSEPGSAEKIKSQDQEVINVEDEKHKSDDVIVIQDDPKPGADGGNFKTKEVVIVDDEDDNEDPVIIVEEADDKRTTDSKGDQNETNVDDSDKLLKSFKRKFPFVPHSVLQDKALDIALDVNLDVKIVEEQLWKQNETYQAQRISVRTFTGKELPHEIDKETYDFNNGIKTIFLHLYNKKKVTEIKDPEEAIESLKIVKNLALEEKFTKKKQELLAEAQAEYDEAPKEELMVLFHGTSEDSLRGIIKDGFQAEAKPVFKVTDVQKRTKMKAYGPGFYLTEYPSKALQYGNALVVCKVLLGNCQPFKKDDWIAKLPIQAGYHSKKIGQGSLDGWIYVVRESSQILPVGIITLKDKNIYNNITARKLKVQHQHFLWPTQIANKGNNHHSHSLTCHYCNQKSNNCFCAPVHVQPSSRFVRVRVPAAGWNTGATVPAMSSLPLGASAFNQASNYGKDILALKAAPVAPPKPSTAVSKFHKPTFIPPNKPARVYKPKPKEAERLGPIQEDFLRPSVSRRRRYAISDPAKAKALLSGKDTKPFVLPFPAKKCKVNLEKIKVDPDTMASGDNKLSKCVVKSPKLVLSKSSSDPGPNLLSLCGLNRDLRKKVEKMKTGSIEENVRIPIVKQTSFVESVSGVATWQRFNKVSQSKEVEESNDRDVVNVYGDQDDGTVVKRKKYE